MTLRVSPHEFAARERAQIRRGLLARYDASARAMPWRDIGDPYLVLVSEFMLQQTRVETILERWGPFVARFPNVRALAKARLESVLKAWEGLGYYRRARNLHAAARLIVAEHGGRVPDTFEALQRLPGVGPYTAAAVASIAFGEAKAVVDGNVTRVLSRLVAWPHDVGTAASKRALQTVADELLSPTRPGDFNQALMDLGAEICKPRTPLCTECPAASHCLAFAAGTQTQHPIKAKRGPLPHRHIAAGLVWKGGKLLIARRPAEGLLGGLWEFPGGKQEAGEDAETACVREIREETGLVVRCDRPFLTVEHAYTHYRISLHLFHCTPLSGRLVPRGLEDPRWVAPRDLQRYPFPRANRRALDRLAEEGPPTKPRRRPGS